MACITIYEAIFEFHWGSTEDPENSEYYYKDIWGSKLKFSNDRCADYGGIVVLLLTENEVAEISNNLINKNFRFQKSFEKQDNGSVTLFSIIQTFSSDRLLNDIIIKS